jgi:hypothetical protein
MLLSSHLHVHLVVHHLWSMGLKGLCHGSPWGLQVLTVVLVILVALTIPLVGGLVGARPGDHQTSFLTLDKNGLSLGDRRHITVVLATVWESRGRTCHRQARAPKEATQGG